MNIQEMHSAFRTLGQQMGMQLVRGILPESIDVYLNDAITLKTRTALEQSVRTPFMEQVDSQARSTAPANLLRTLYRRVIFNIYDFVKNKDLTQWLPRSESMAVVDGETSIINQDVIYKYISDNGVTESINMAKDFTNEVLKTGQVELQYNGLDLIITKNKLTPGAKILSSAPYLGIVKKNDKYLVVVYSSLPTTCNIFSSIYLKSQEDSKISGLGSYDVSYENGRYDIILPTTKFYTKIGVQESDVPKGKWIEPMMYLGFGIKYFDARNKTNSFVKARLIGADMLETTLRDFNNSADRDNPVVSLLSDENGWEYIELYTNTPRIRLDQIDVRYIKTPNVVKFSTDISNCVDCDLPDYCHFEIVEMAVMKYFQSIGATGNNNNNNNNNNN